MQQDLLLRDCRRGAVAAMPQAKRKSSGGGEQKASKPKVTRVAVSCPGTQAIIKWFLGFYFFSQVDLNQMIHASIADTSWEGFKPPSGWKRMWWSAGVSRNTWIMHSTPRQGCGVPRLPQHCTSNV